MKELEKSRFSNNAKMINAIIAEEMFSLHLFPDLPETFEFSSSI